MLACAAVRPEGIHGMTPKSVKKKLKTPAFAAAVNRDEVRQGAEELGVDFDEHIATVIAALEERADELELHGRARPSPPESMAARERYARVLRAPHARALLLAEIPARLPIGINGLAIVLVHARARRAPTPPRARRPPASARRSASPRR